MVTSNFPPFGLPVVDRVELGVTGHGDSQNHAAHSGIARVVAVRVFVLLCYVLRHLAVAWLQRQRQAHVRHAMAVVKPAARLLGHPGDLERLHDVGRVRELFVPLALFQHVVVFAVALGVEPEVKTVQVHRMAEVRHVEDFPMDRLAHLGV